MRARRDTLPPRAEGSRREPASLPPRRDGRAVEGGGLDNHNKSLGYQVFCAVECAHNRPESHGMDVIDVASDVNSGRTGQLLARVAVVVREPAR
jgi:hypothetical protein